MKPNFTNYWNWNNKVFKFDIYLDNNFENLDDVKQVYAIVIDSKNENVLFVHGKNGMHLLPGGTVEPGESLVETLVREVKEETNRDIDINTITPFFYQKSYQKDIDGNWKYLRTEVRYIVKVLNDLDFVEDPDNGDIVKAEWTPINQIHSFLNWGDTSIMMEKRIPEILKDMTL
jgi:8-oxo-dGTP pyrophosphatase MutT (NUDIX family)